MKTKKILLVSLLALPFYLVPASAETGSIIDPKQSLGLIRNVYLVVDDQVSGKCWTNVSQVKQRARLTLEQSGIRVYEEPLVIISPFSTNLVITGLGMRVGNGGCAGDVQVQSFREIFSEFGEAKLKSISVNFSRNTVAFGGMNLNDSFLDATDTYVSQIAADVIAGRRNSRVSRILSEFPAEKSEPVTMRRFMEMMGEAFDGKE